jgi:hypothetical protein
MTAYVLQSLSNYLANRVTTDAKLSYIRDLELADENPFSSDPMDLIIAANQYRLLLLDGLRKGTVPSSRRTNTRAYFVSSFFTREAYGTKDHFWLDYFRFRSIVSIQFFRFYLELTVLCLVESRCRISTILGS